MPKQRVLISRVFSWAVLCVVFLQGARGLAETWREIQSPHFRVMTDGSDKEGQAVAKEFEQMRAVFAVEYPKVELEPGAPLLIVAVHDMGLKDLGSMFVKQKENIAGEYFQGWERQYAMVRLDTFGELNQAVVFHEYAHSILHANMHWLPTWLDEGMAEFYGYTRFSGDHVYVGAPSVRLRHANSAVLLSIAEMMDGPRKFGKDSERVDLFYGEAWAMVHYMTFGPEMGNGAKISAFIAALESGSSQADAFQQVFGDQKQFYNKLSQYVSQFSFKAGLLPSVQVADAKTFPAKVLTPAERDYDLGSLDIGAHLVAEGKARMEAAVTADTKLAGPHEELGFLAWREGRDEEAKAQWRMAVEADPKSYRAAFALLMSGRALKDQTPQELEQTQHALDALHEIAPRFAPVLVELALIHWRQGKMNAAFKDSLAAEKLQPWRAEYRLLTARILTEGHQPKIAAKYARMVADRWPGSDHDEAVEVWNALPADARGEGPALKLSFAADATVVRGTILSTSCEKAMSVVMQPVGDGLEPVKVTATGPFESGFADTLWVGEDHYTPCHHLEGLPAVVAYKDEGGVKKLLVLEVRDNLPTAVAVKP